MSMPLEQLAQADQRTHAEVLGSLDNNPVDTPESQDLWLTDFYILSQKQVRGVPALEDPKVADFFKGLLEDEDYKAQSAGLKNRIIDRLTEDAGMIEDNVATPGNIIRYSSDLKAAQLLGIDQLEDAKDFFSLLPAVPGVEEAEAPQQPDDLDARYKLELGKWDEFVKKNPNWQTEIEGDSHLRDEFLIMARELGQVEFTLSPKSASERLNLVPEGMRSVLLGAVFYKIDDQALERVTKIGEGSLEGLSEVEMQVIHQAELEKELRAGERLDPQEFAGEDLDESRVAVAAPEPVSTPSEADAAIDEESLARMPESMRALWEFMQSHTEEEIKASPGLLQEHSNLTRKLEEGVFELDPSQIDSKIFLSIASGEAREKILATVQNMGDQAPEDWKKALDELIKIRLVTKSGLESARKRRLDYFTRKEWIDKVGLGTTGEEATKSFNEVAEIVIKGWKEFNSNPPVHNSDEYSKFFAIRDTQLEGLRHTFEFMDFNSANPEIVEHCGEPMMYRILAKVRQLGEQAPDKWKQALDKMRAKYEEYGKGDPSRFTLDQRLDQTPASQASETPEQQANRLFDLNLKIFTREADERRIIFVDTPDQILKLYQTFNFELKNSGTHYERKRTLEENQKILERKLSLRLNLDESSSYFTLEELHDQFGGIETFDIDSVLRGADTEREFKSQSELLRKLFENTSGSFKAKLEDMITHYQRVQYKPKNERDFYKDKYTFQWHTYKAEAGVDPVQETDLVRKREAEKRTFEDAMNSSGELDIDKTIQKYINRNKAEIAASRGLLEGWRKVKEWETKVADEAGMVIHYSYSRYPSRAYLSAKAA